MSSKENSSPKKSRKPKPDSNENGSPLQPNGNGGSSPKKEPKRKKSTRDLNGGDAQQNGLPPPEKSPKPKRDGDKSPKPKRGSVSPSNGSTVATSPSQPTMTNPAKSLSSSASQPSLSSSSRKDGQEENVKVAVRIRPFNKRETERNSKLIVDMNGKQTILKNMAEPNKDHTFAFDYSYWSHDGCKENKDGYFEADPSQPNANKYCDQKRVFNDLGKKIVFNTSSLRSYLDDHVGHEHPRRLLISDAHCLRSLTLRSLE